MVGGFGQSTRGAVPSDARRHNRALVLNTLLREGSMSRADLAGRTKITKATMTDLVGALVADGLILERGVREGSRVGRPAILLDFNTAHRRVIALDLSSHHSFHGAVLGLDSAIVERRSLPLEGATGQDALRVLEDLTGQLRALADAPVLGVSVGTPGRVLQDGADVDAPALGWHGVDLRTIVSTAAGAPALVENDANLAAIAESRLGDEAVDDLFLVRIGRGIGAGIVVDGQLLEGRHSIAGEIGHVTVGDGSGPMCVCGRTGCLEAWISVPSLVTAAGEADPDRALAVAGERLGIVLGPVTAAIDVGCVVLSGPPDVLDGAFRAAAEQTLRRRTLAGFHPDLPVRLAGVPDAVLRGAGMRVVARELGVV